MASVETTPAGVGLREQKQLETRTAIGDAARELFEAQGFAATTIPQIAARAHVSPRTVSYYFPVKEELVFPDRDELLDALGSALENRLDGESASEALSRWLTTSFTDRSDADEERDRCRRAIVDADPGLRAFELELQSQAASIVAASFAADLSLPPDHHVPRMIAAATLGALKSLSPEDGHKPDPEEAKALVRDVMTFIDAGARGIAGE